MDSLKSSKYQYSVRLLTAASRVPGRFSAVEENNILEQRKAELCFRKDLALAVFDGVHCLSRTQKLVDFRDSGTK